MYKRLLIVGFFLLLPACSVCVGQANMAGINNNACCSTKEMTVISNNSRGENTIVNQNPSSSPNPTSTPVSLIPVATGLPSPNPTISPSPVPSSSGG